MHKCLKQDEYEEETSLNTELLQIYNNFNLNSLKQLNTYAVNTEQQQIAFLKDFNNNTNSNVNLLASFASLNSPVSINSPTTSTNNQKQDEDDREEFLLSSANNQLMIGELANNNQTIQVAADSNLQTTVGDEFIIDNRRNINQNRIKSSILGAAKHKRQSNLVKGQHVTNETIDNNIAINLTINSPSSSSICSIQNWNQNANQNVNQNVNQNTTITGQSNAIAAKKCICHLCNTSFTQRNSLNRHIRSHTGKRVSFLFSIK